MINDVITQITEAESKAEEIIAAAHETSKQIAQGAHAEVETLRTEFMAETNRMTRELLDAAREEADRAAQDSAKESEAKAAQLARNAEKNAQRTVEWLAEMLIKNNS